MGVLPEDMHWLTKKPKKIKIGLQSGGGYATIIRLMIFWKLLEVTTCLFGRLLSVRF